MKRVAQSLVCVLLVMVTMFTVAIEESYAASLELLTIECIQPEDNNGDEVYLWNGQEEKIWPTNAPYIEMEANDFENINVIKQFTGTYTVDLYDLDSPDPDDLLGSFTADENELGIFEKSLTGFTWNYNVKYKVSE